MKKWSQFLAESQEEVLQEFNKKDLEAVLKDGDKFTVSFEIELEADAEQEDDYGDYYGDDYYEAREEARNEAAREYFNNNAEDYLRGEIRENGYLEDHWDETPSDGEEIFEWFAEDRGFSPNKDNIVRIAVDVGAVKRFLNGLPKIEDLAQTKITLSELQSMLRLVILILQISSSKS